MAKTVTKPVDETPTVDALKARLEAVIAERQALVTARAELQRQLIESWGKPGVNDVVNEIALNENKVSALSTLIEHAEGEYNRALGASYLGEYAALRDEIAALHDKRQTLTAELAAAQQTYELSRYGLEQAEGNFAGMLSSATSLVEPAIMPFQDMTERYARAVETHEVCLKADMTRLKASGELRRLEAEYLELYHEISLKERRAHELGALTGSPFDPQVAYRAG